MEPATLVPDQEPIWTVSFVIWMLLICTLAVLVVLIMNKMYPE